ncbi:MAG TPA: adenylate/guanylate cyclase domain-containing protein [Stellaceae bacterium]|nr:adenylate/guanylate cyclase domain-containing protein [Stellaceae bacterium]
MTEIIEIGPRRRKLAAILHADVAGFSRLMGRDEEGTHRALGELRRAVDPLIAARGGRIVGTAGDSLLADFVSVVDALDCAVAMQQAAHTLNEQVPPDLRLEFRIGINLGDVIIDGEDIFGDGVNIAARLEGLAQPGTVCISHTVYEQVRNKLQLDYRPLGSHRVKNIAEPVRAYAVGAPRRISLRRSATRHRLAAIAAVVFVVMAGLAGWAWQAGIDERLGFGAPAKPIEVAGLAAAAGLAGRTSIAVLPFKNLSPDAGRDYFSDGITEDVTTALGRFSNLLVVAKSASFAYKDRNLAPAKIGNLLGAQYLLGGSVRRSGGRVRIVAELTEAASGRLVWSDAYDGKTKDVFAVQEDIARRVVGAAAVKLTEVERVRVLARPTRSLAAYEYVLRGREYFSQATSEQNDEARDMFQRAIGLDPNYADAYAALGFAHHAAVLAGWTEFPQDETERAETLARKALALDPATTSAYQLLAILDLYRRRYDLALAQIDRALQINPSDANSYETRAAILTFAGRASEALLWIEATLRFDHSNPSAIMDLCVADYVLGRYVEAVAACDRAAARNPGRFAQTVIHPFLAATYAELGRIQDTEDERAATTRISPFFDPERFAAQFGTQDARDRALAGLRKAGFH